MDQVNPRLWAKKKEDRDGMYWLSLRDHLADTQAVIGLLWEHWLSPHQRQMVTDSFSRSNTGTHGREDIDAGKRAACFLAAVHDIGKALPLFQAKRGFPRTDELDRILACRLEWDGFVGISELTLRTNKLHHTVAGENLLAYYGVAEDVYSIVGAHHGKSSDQSVEMVAKSGDLFAPEVTTIPSNFASYTKAYFQAGSLETKDPVERNLFTKWERVQRDIFTWALHSSGYCSVEELPRIGKTGAVILTGLIIMADWIASNEEYFPLLPLDEFIDVSTEVVVADREERVLLAWERWRKSDLWEENWLPSCRDLYRERFGFSSLRDAQVVFAEVAERVEDPGILVFEAPMGLGKTEAALVGAEILAYRKHMGGVYFGLPTQATSNGIFPRMADWLRRVEEASDTDLSIRLAHGKAALNQDFTGLAHHIDEDGERSPVVNEWFAGRKKTSLDDFVVGTIDQLLLMALKQKHVFLRHLGFSKKVVIIDEVHSYDAYMSVYLHRALEWLGAYDVPVIILSATLPATKRKELIMVYLKGKGIKRRDLVFDSQVLGEAYPLVTYSDGRHVRVQAEFAPIDETTVSVVPCDSDEPDEIIHQLAATDGIIGVVVNTVRKAQELGRRMVAHYGTAHVSILHSGFIDTMRRHKEDRLCRALGKDGDRPAFQIVIGTQVIEQSLDIDFDVMISDLAPMDLLLQRVGRLHRHTRRRPPAFAEPQLYVLGIHDNYEFEDGTKHIYDEYVLHRTQNFLPDKIILPRDISGLVQAVYNEELIDIELSELCEDRKQVHIKNLERQKERANIYSLNRPSSKREPTLIRWLANPNRQDMSETKASAQVRDIEETIEVIAVKKVGNGYGIFADETDISGSITKSDIARRVAAETIRLPRCLSAPWQIDSTIHELERYNLEHLGEWQDSVWLKGMLGLVFDEHNEFSLRGYRLRYDPELGLQCEKEEEDGEV